MPPADGENLSELAPLDQDEVRAHFPALAGPHAGWALLDNAGGTAPLGSVIDRIAAYMRSVPVQTGASYPASVEAAEQVREAAVRMARLVGGGPDGRIVFGPSSTAMIGRVARGLAPSLRPGDELVVTDLDHEANITPWSRIAEQHDLRLRWWRVDRDSMRLQLDDLDPLLNERTRLVAVTQTSNITGRIEPTAEVVRRAQAAGARVLVDGVGYVPHQAADVVALGADYYAFSLYKVFGPHHAALYGSDEALAALANLNHEQVPDDMLGYRLQPGSASYELSVGSTAIVDYLEALGDGDVTAGYGRIAAHEQALTTRLLDYLESRGDARVIGPTTSEGEARVAIVSFVLPGRSSSEVPGLLELRRLGVRYGHFNAPRLIERLGLSGQDGVVRVSLAHYNSDKEISRLIHALDELV